MTKSHLLTAAAVVETLNTVETLLRLGAVSSKIKMALIP